METLRIDEALERKQIERLQAAKSGRDSAALASSPAAIGAAAATDGNLMPLLIDAARIGASEGEIVRTLQQVWGEYREAPIF